MAAAITGRVITTVTGRHRASTAVLGTADTGITAGMAVVQAGGGWSAVLGICTPTTSIPTRIRTQCHWWPYRLRHRRQQARPIGTGAVTQRGITRT